MKRHNVLYLGTWVSVVVLLTGCGGGTGDSSPVNVDPEASLRAELNTVLSRDPDDVAAREALAELDRSAAEHFGLIYTLELDGAMKFFFFEPMPGKVALLESGPVDVEPYSSRFDFSAVNFPDIFTLLRPEDTVPGVLLDAQARAVRFAEAAEVGTDDGLTPVNRLRSAPDLALPKANYHLEHVTSSGTHFVSGHGGCPTFGNVDFCWLNRTGSWTESNSSTRSSQMRVGNYGTTNFSFRFTTPTGSIAQTILAGALHTFTQARLNSLSTITGQLIQDAGASTWHWGGTFNNQ